MEDFDEYNGDAVHDMWVDYTTDVYEGTDYTGEYDAEPEGWHGSAGDEPRITPSTLMSVQHYKRRVDELEGMIATALASAAILEEKSANASSPKNIRKFYRRAIEKQSEAKRYQDELETVKQKYIRAQIRAEGAKTRVLTWICIPVSLIAILLAWLF